MARGQTLTPARQRKLFRRWTIDAATLHSHEPAVGLLGLLHGASIAELRSLRVSDLNLKTASVTLCHRPHPTPLDPPTITALDRCLRPHEHPDTNPHLFVSRKAKTTNRPVSGDYLARLLKPADVSPMQLRTTRLAHLATVMDPVLIAAAFGISRGAALHYLTDHVDDSRHPAQPVNP